MQRLLITLPALAERHNLVLATWKAARGRQQRPVVARFLATLDQRLDSLAASILDQTAPQGRMRRFTIFDPKQREITAACFADRVLHHALLPRALTVWLQRPQRTATARAGSAPTMHCTPRWPTPTAGACASACGRASPACKTTLATTQRRLVKVPA